MTENKVRREGLSAVCFTVGLLLILFSLPSAAITFIMAAVSGFLSEGFVWFYGVVLGAAAVFLIPGIILIASTGFADRHRGRPLAALPFLSLILLVFHPVVIGIGFIVYRITSEV